MAPEKRPPQKVLFVCLGNICRSPTAEAVFKKKNQDLKMDILFDSAGTSANHVGETSDPRSIHHAQLRGYVMDHQARQLTFKDLIEFDLILTMDESNFQNTWNLAKGDSQLVSKIQKITDFCSPEVRLKTKNAVPDPYFGGAQGFEEVLDILENAAQGFFKKNSKVHS